MELDLAPFHNTNADVGNPRSDVVVALHKSVSAILKIDPSQLGAAHNIFSIDLNSLLVVQAGVSIEQLFELNTLPQVYLRCVPSRGVSHHSY